MSYNSIVWNRVVAVMGIMSLLPMLIVLYGSLLNNAGIKYASVRSTSALKHLVSHSYISYDSSLKYTVGKAEEMGCVVALNVPNSLICCDDDSRSNEWICRAAFDPVNKMFTKSITRAIIFPLLPLFFSGLGDYKASIDSRQQAQSLKSFMLRMTFYIAVIIFRTVRQ